MWSHAIALFSFLDISVVIMDMILRYMACKGWGRGGDDKKKKINIVHTTLTYTLLLTHKQGQFISTTNKQGRSLAFKRTRGNKWMCVLAHYISPSSMSCTALISGWGVSYSGYELFSSHWKNLLPYTHTHTQRRQHPHDTWQARHVCFVYIYLYVCVGLHSKPCNQYNILQH